MRVKHVSFKLPLITFWKNYEKTIKKKNDAHTLTLSSSKNHGPLYLGQSIQDWTK